jgi:hypothetical protein
MLVYRSQSVDMDVAEQRTTTYTRYDFFFTKAQGYRWIGLNNHVGMVLPVVGKKISSFLFFSPTYEIII